MNNKGQALIEFVLILPVILMIMFIIVDFGVIFMGKNKLENTSNDIIELIRNGKDIDYISNLYKDYDISIITEEEFIKVVVKDDVKLITPGANRIIDNPYELKVERIISNA